jgi:uncharacterized membrane protein (UPF0127 family)
MGQERTENARLRDRPARPDAQIDKRIRVTNITRQTTVAACVDVADRGPKRSKGLLGRKSLEPGTGLWIVPCEAVHTFWMQFAIDLVYLDRNLRVRKVKESIRPWRLSGCVTAHSVLELAPGAIRESQTQAGDKFEFAEIASDGVESHG